MLEIDFYFFYSEFVSNFLKCNFKFYVFVFFVLLKIVFSVSTVVVFLLLCNRTKAL